MRINITITDETIMQDIQQAIDDLTEDEEISIPDGEKEAFAVDCFDEIASKAECYADYIPTWAGIVETVRGMAADAGYTL